MSTRRPPVLFIRESADVSVGATGTDVSYSLCRVEHGYWTIDRVDTTSCTRLGRRTNLAQAQAEARSDWRTR